MYACHLYVYSHRRMPIISSNIHLPINTDALTLRHTYAETQLKHAHAYSCTYAGIIF